MREIERFETRGTSGRTYTVIRWAKQIPFKPVSGGTEMLDGGNVLQLVDGSHVNELQRGKKYQIFDTDEELERTS